MDFSLRNRHNIWVWICLSCLWDLSNHHRLSLEHDPPSSNSHITMHQTRWPTLSQRKGKCFFLYWVTVDSPRTVPLRVTVLLWCCYFTNDGRLHVDGITMGQLWAPRYLFIFPVHQEGSTILMTNQYSQIWITRPASILWMKYREYNYNGNKKVLVIWFSPVGKLPRKVKWVSYWRHYLLNKGSRLKISFKCCFGPCIGKLKKPRFGGIERSGFDSQL